jgi:hypothetical protein
MVSGEYPDGQVMPLGSAFDMKNGGASEAPTDTHQLTTHHLTCPQPDRLTP